MATTLLDLSAEVKDARQKGETIMRSRITRFLLVLASVALVAVGASRCSDSYSALTQPPSNVTPPPGATPTPVGY